jgi:hypothetical protein
MQDAAAHESPPLLPRERCGYDLNGLGSGTRIVCPECGLEQPRRTSLPAWPQGWNALAWQCGPTLALCNLCLLTLLALVLWAPVLSSLLLLLAAVTFLSGPIVPIVTGWVLSRRHEPRGIHAFILLGWLANFLIGAIYLVIAFGVGVLGSI